MTGNANLSTAQSLRFLGVYLLAAFVAMLAARTLGLGDLVRGGLALLVHAAAGALAYAATMRPAGRTDADALDEVVENVAITFGLFAVAKHVVLYATGIVAAQTAGAALDQAATWLVETAFVSTSLVVDVAMLGAVPVGVRLAAAHAPGAIAAPGSVRQER